VLGSPGGPRIITTVAKILVDVVDFGLDIQQAVNAPRFHHQWLPDKLYVERIGFSPDTLRMLERLGHNIDYGSLDTDTGQRSASWSDGECIAIDLKTGMPLGASDGRNDTGKAVGY
jgi:gamma-glutamyltranspeptidase/glutathione hydrolase